MSGLIFGDGSFGSWFLTFWRFDFWLFGSYKRAFGRYFLLVVYYCVSGRGIWRFMGCLYFLVSWLVSWVVMVCMKEEVLFVSSFS